MAAIAIIALFVGVLALVGPGHTYAAVLAGGTELFWLAVFGCAIGVALAICSGACRSDGESVTPRGASKAA